MHVDQDIHNLKNVIKNKQIITENNDVEIRMRDDGILDDKLLCFPKEIENIFNNESKISKIEIVKLLIKKPSLFFILFKISYYFFKSLMVLRKVSTKIFKIKSF